MKMFLGGLRFRLTVVYSTLFGFFICVFAFILSGQYMDLLRHDFDSALLNFGVDLSNEEVLGISDYNIGIRIPRNESNKEFPFVMGDAVYLLRDVDGRILTKGTGKTADMEIPYRADLPKSPDYTHRFLTFEKDGREYRGLNMKITNASGKERILQVAIPADILSEQRDRLLIMNLLTIPLLIVISSIVSYLVAGNALSPIKLLTEGASSIAAENLSKRVPELDTGDEVAELARTFNNLLERLEKSFRAQENFVANASHQLNTPLAIIKGELDVLESKERGPEEEARFRKSLREELERLIELVKKLLLISRVEAGNENFVMGPLRVDEILLATTARLSEVAKKKKLNIRFNIAENLEEESLLVKGDRQLLDAMFENILENAVKYSPEESTITIELEKNNHHTVVSVSDEGPGISAENWAKITRSRFQRADGINLPGTGIGLSIVQTIAGLHGASLQMSPRKPKGSKFVLAFPQQKSL